MEESTASLDLNHHAVGGVGVRNLLLANFAYLFVQLVCQRDISCLRYFRDYFRGDIFPGGVKRH